MSQSTEFVVAPHVQRVDDRLRYVVALACAGSAGVHAGLTPAHLAEGPVLAAAFASSAAAMLVAALGIRSASRSRWAPLTAASVLATVASAYVLSRTIGIPMLVAEPEELDALGFGTTAVEAVGTAAALMLLIRKDTE